MNVGVIPARLESTRFPRKILFPINNRPMVVHVYERALMASKLDKVLIAVDSDITGEILNGYGISTIMTSQEHQSGTDRIAEVVKEIDADIVLNLQADEPMMDPKLIDYLIESFNDEDVKIATLASTVINENDISNLNTVKVDIDDKENAIGFYREVSEIDRKYFRHIGIYGYRKNILLEFTKLDQSANEKRLRLEQLRALDNGIPIKVVKCDYKYNGIDTPEDLKQLNAFIKNINYPKDQF